MQAKAGITLLAFTEGPAGALFQNVWVSRTEEVPPTFEDSGIGTASNRVGTKALSGACALYRRFRSQRSLAGCARRAIDEYFLPRHVPVIGAPTGQAFVIKQVGHR